MFCYQISVQNFDMSVIKVRKNMLIIAASHDVDGEMNLAKRAKGFIKRNTLSFTFIIFSLSLRSSVD